MVESDQEKCGNSIFVIWILQAEKNYVRILCSMKIWKPFAFILFRKVFIFSGFCSFLFCKCKPLPSLTDIHILRDSVPDLNISSRSVTVNTFNWLERIFSPEEVGGGLATGWFVSVANFAPHIFGRNSCGKILEGKFSNAEIWCHVRANWEKF